MNWAGFNKWVTLYAKDQNKFFEDFAAAFGKLMVRIHVMIFPALWLE
jgi:catalase (peroxidase I)